MCYLATKKKFKTVCLYLFSLLILMPVPLSKAQENTKNFLLIITKSNQDNGLKNNYEDDVYAVHLKNLKHLLNDGYLVLHGVLDQGGGIFSGKENDLLHIQTVLRKDELLDSGTYAYRFKTLDRSNGYLCPYEEGCEEIRYQLINFLSNLNKETVKIAADMEHKHQRYLDNSYQKGQILLSGRFEDRAGWFVIYQGNDFREFAYHDPAVVNNYYVPEFFSFSGCLKSGCTTP